MNEDNIPVTPDNGSNENSNPPGNGAEIQLTVPFADQSKDIFTGLIETLKLVLLKPTYFFKNYQMGGAIGKSLLFAVIVGWFSGTISLLLAKVSDPDWSEMIRKIFPELENLGNAAPPSQFQSILSFIMIPVGIMIGLFFISLIFHGVMSLLQGANRSFETTFNIVAYASASSLLRIIPVIGGPASAIYGIVLNAIGLSEGHRTDRWKGVVAALIPYLLCIICLLAFFQAMGGVDGLTEFIRNSQ
ncbi:MAG: hypothetical protein GY765_43335 [bacterium]|nr:hypothetical protein [bacterium]